MRTSPRWRSCLFVPVNVDRFVEKAHLRGADAIVLDLEDSVAAGEKDHARSLVAAAAAKVSRNGADVIVRINGPWRLAIKDLEAVVVTQVRAIMVPKVESPGQLRMVDSAIGDIETERQLPSGQTGLIAEIETASGLMRAREIATASPRLISAFLGGEDFALSVGTEPTEEVLTGPALQVARAVRAAGLMPMGFVGSIADFSDRAAFARMIRRSQRLGFRGGFCIHPDQVAILNDGFSPATGRGMR